MLVKRTRERGLGGKGSHAASANSLPIVRERAQNHLRYGNTPRLARYGSGAQRRTVTEATRLRPIQAPSSGWPRACFPARTCDLPAIW